MDTGYFTKREIAEYLKISLATLERLMKEGLPHIKLSRRVLFRKADVDAWLESKIISR
ncbi:MAG: helix-turn-helix domain-containing protein [Acidobacteriota bacterium]|nr:helix-turn-helix domain-containing protein [Acidobacteriota bacterium]